MTIAPIQATRPARPDLPVRNGPGWFDSSFDLHAGLDVRDGWPADAGVGEWIEGWLWNEANSECIDQNVMNSEIATASCVDATCRRRGAHVSM